MNDMTNNIRKSQTLSAEVRNLISDLNDLEKRYQEGMVEIENFIQVILKKEEMKSSMLTNFDDRMYIFSEVFHELEMLFETIGGIDLEIIDVDPLLEEVKKSKNFLQKIVKIQYHYIREGLYMHKLDQRQQLKTMPMAS